MGLCSLSRRGRSVRARISIPAFAFIFPFILIVSAGAWAQKPSAPDKPSEQPAAIAPASISQVAQPGQTSLSGSTSEAESSQAGKADHAPNAPSLPPGIDPVQKIPLYETIVEDWSSLAIGTSHLYPVPPLVAQTEDHDTFTRTLVQLKWRPGDPLDLYVILPKNVKKPPAVLYLYGYKDDTDRFREDRWCQHATARGVAAIGFVSALTGHRFHDRPLRQWFVSELQESLGSTVHDVKFILDYLSQRGDIDMKRIGMFGQSSGAAIALLAAAADPRIKAVDVLDPWGDWPAWLKDSWVVKDDAERTDFAADPVFLKRVAPLDPVKWLPTLKSTRIRITQVMDNDATPDECKDAIRKVAPKRAQVVRYDHAGQFMEAYRNGSLFDWVKAQLQALPTAPVTPKQNVATRATDPSAPRADSLKAR